MFGKQHTECGKEDTDKSIDPIKPMGGGAGDEEQEEKKTVSKVKSKNKIIDWSVGKIRSLKISDRTNNSMMIIIMN